MWNDEQRAEFLLKGFELIHQNNRAIRERVHSNARYSVSFFLLVSAFLLANKGSVSRELLMLAGMGIALVAAITIGAMSKQFETLKTQHEILANLERAMLFHTVSVYLAGETLFPVSASAEKLESFMFYSKLRHAYYLIVLATAVYAIVVTLFVGQPPA